MPKRWAKAIDAAEAVVAACAGDRFEAHSTGTEPTQVRVEAVAVMALDNRVAERDDLRVDQAQVAANEDRAGMVRDCRRRSSLPRHRRGSEGQAVTLTLVYD